jgi:3-oxoacyl-(acyl-carrier-protein) synthase/NAD(P)-dependent dehydrogenase (short-subunit alcohol dehydrogenase family)
VQRDKTAILRSLDEGRISLDEARRTMEEILKAERIGQRSVCVRPVEDTFSPPKACIAIIGMSGRFPGARNVEALWTNLASGTTSVTQAPTDRGWDVLDYFDPNPQTPGKTYVCKGCFLDGIDEFDPLFFGISPREAALIDPAERLFLQEAWRAVEDAGYGPERVSGRTWGVFAAVKGDYETYIQQTDPTYFLGTESFAAARLSYLLHLVGPAVTIDTACSSTLVAISQACDNLLLGNCQVAVAGGASVYSTPTTLITASQSLLFSPDARCCAFDDRANGTVLGEAAGAVVLKPLADAQRDGDAIFGVIRGWGVNQDGRTNGITAPSMTSQTRLQTSVYKRFGINPEAITLVEAHGTGTKLGDPIEFAALAASFRAFTTRSEYCALAAVKPNIGHTFFAAGIASTIKVLLCLMKRQIPPSINFGSVNGHIALAKSPFYISTELRDWKVEKGQMRCAAINSFGLTGTNSHLVVEEYKSAGSRRLETPANANLPPMMLFPLSAQNEERLAEYSHALIEHLDTLEASTTRLAQIAFTLQVGRREMDERLAIVASSISELRQRLAGALSGSPNLTGVFRGRVGRGAVRPGAPELNAWIRTGDLERLGQAWIEGTEIDWYRLWDGEPPGTNHLPTYPFAKERCWFPRRGFNADEVASVGEGISQPDETVHVDVASVEQSSGRKWLCFTERWSDPTPGCPTIDWSSYKESGKGNHVVVVSADETDCLELEEQLRHIIANGAPAAVRTPRVEWLNIKSRPVGGATQSPGTPGDPVSDFSWQNAEPDIVFIFLPVETTAEHERAHLDLVLQCCQALMTYCWERHIEIYLCCKSGTATSTPRDDAFSGLLRSAMLENPNHRYRWIQHDAHSAVRAGDLVRECFHRELGTGHVLPLVRYQDGARSVSSYEEIERVAMSGRPCGLRPDHAYLIIGGLGEVGRRLCRQIAGKYQCTLVIVSRRTPDDETERMLADVRAAGSRVFFFSADVAVPGAMAGVYEDIKRQIGRIDGVIHLARAVDDGPIIAKSIEAFEQTIAAKVRGTEIVDQLTREEPLEFFLMFSSMAGFGIAGSADYAYACAFQNAFARYRNHLRDRGERQGRSLALCWGQWEADQYVDEERRASWQRRGLDLVDAASALRVMEACLNSQDAVLGWVAVTDKVCARTALAQGPVARKGASADDGGIRSRAARTTPAGVPSDASRAALKAALESLSYEELRALYSAVVVDQPITENAGVNQAT